MPEIRASGPGAQQLAATATQIYNDMVDAGLAGISANITRLDTFQLLTDLVQNPADFDLPADIDVENPCFTGFVAVPGTVCGDPENYVFFDRIHPTHVVHQVLGSQAAAAVPEPALIALMGLGLLGMACNRRQRKAIA
ncbi:MAG: PEP-CTERM sorting domain-containing protein [Gammaproteobacteria bacterium]|nr:PEP-CTERM sorting domain-containing protein [Gammaproteobacteria bacterium]